MDQDWRHDAAGLGPYAMYDELPVPSLDYKPRYVSGVCEYRLFTRAMLSLIS